MSRCPLSGLFRFCWCKNTGQSLMGYLSWYWEKVPSYIRQSRWSSICICQSVAGSASRHDVPSSWRRRERPPRCTTKEAKCTLFHIHSYITLRTDYLQNSKGTVVSSHHFAIAMNFDQRGDWKINKAVVTLYRRTHFTGQNDHFLTHKISAKNLTLKKMSRVCEKLKMWQETK